jgi:hypothetical protein
MSLQIDTNAFDRLERFHRELESNKRFDHPMDITASPYLAATIKEPYASAWLPQLASTCRSIQRVDFQVDIFPPGADMGRSSFQLRDDPIVFPDPKVLFRTVGSRKTPK